MTRSNTSESRPWPCPFCGTDDPDDLGVWFSISRGAYFAGCVKCQSQGPWSASAREANALWCERH